MRLHPEPNLTLHYITDLPGYFLVILVPTPMILVSILSLNGVLIYGSWVIYHLNLNLISETLDLLSMSLANSTCFI